MILIIISSNNYTSEIKATTGKDRFIFIRSKDYVPAERQINKMKEKMENFIKAPML